MSDTPIADFALLSDCHTAALVSRTGAVEWLCFPRFDSHATFARLLDDRAGHFSIRPAGEVRASRRYRDRSMVLETTFDTAGGRAVLTDALAMGPNERGHELGADSPRALLRRISCLEGNVELEVEYSPRPEFGLVEPLLTAVDAGVIGRGGADVLLLSTAVPLDVTESAARGRFTLRAGEAAGFALQHRKSFEAPPLPWSEAEIADRLEDTTRGWRTWSDLHQRYEGPWRELVHQSGRVLQALTYYPTGAIVASATTSLAESVGGVRNWDYRFTWVRDAAMTLNALWVAACPDEAYRFFDYLAGAAFTQVHRASELQIMFGIGGEHDLAERELSRLAGWRGSRPVRVGNGAWSQRQLDVYGEVMAAVDRLREQLAGITPPVRRFLVNLVNAAATRWKDPDHGIWEMRAAPRHFVYSKLMCWVALDRAIGLASLLGAEDSLPRWTAIRDEIRRTILERSWSDRVQAFTQSFGCDDLDASNLVMPMVGFLPATEPRVLATIRAIAERLTGKHGLVYRYLADDGLEGEEGAFLLCTFWLAHAWALAGELDRAREIFARAAGFANDVGLFSEEADPESGELLGNFPQAFTHIGLVNAAWAITLAEQGKAAP